MPELMEPRMDALPMPVRDLAGQAHLFALGDTAVARALRLRARGVEQPRRMAWFRAAETAIVLIADRQSVLTVLDLRRELEALYRRPWPIDERALGIVLDAARRAGLIDHAGGYADLDGQPVRIWRSMRW